MHGGVLIDLEESWSVVKDDVGPRQTWSCSKQSWCYGDLLRYSQDDSSAVVIASGISYHYHTYYSGVSQVILTVFNDDSVRLCKNVLRFIMRMIRICMMTTDSATVYLRF